MVWSNREIYCPVVSSMTRILCTEFMNFVSTNDKLLQKDPSAEREIMPNAYIKFYSLRFSDIPHQMKVIILYV